MMISKEIVRTSIKDKKEFTFDGSLLRFEAYNPDTNKYLYSRWFGKDSPGYGRQMGWEVVIPVKRKQPDGSIIECYPSSEQFGRYGWFYPPRYSKEDMIESLSH